MDDLEQKLTSLLGDPAALERVESLLHSLGTEAPTKEAPAADPAPAAPDGLLSQLGPLLSTSAGGSPDTALLRALRPYLHGEREKRLDDALHLMQLREILPLLNRS